VEKDPLGVDPDTGFIHCHTTTTNPESDESQVDDLLDQVGAEIDEVYLDGAYDAQSCYDGLLERDIYLISTAKKRDKVVLGGAG
jgi:IS5 family transposase